MRHSYSATVSQRVLKVPGRVSCGQASCGRDIFIGGQGKRARGQNEKKPGEDICSFCVDGQASGEAHYAGIGAAYLSLPIGFGARDGVRCQGNRRNRGSYPSAGLSICWFGCQVRLHPPRLSKNLKASPRQWSTIGKSMNTISAGRKIMPSFRFRRGILKKSPPILSTRNSTTPSQH